jgi:alpha-1,3-fucosyltransferase 10
MLPRSSLLILVPRHFPGWESPDLRDSPWPCTFTRDLMRWDEADAILCHLPTWRGSQPLPRRLDQTLIALCQESEVSCPLLGDADFMRQFDIVVSHRRDATIRWTYLEPSIVPLLRAPPPAKSEPALAVCFVSNAVDRCRRAAYIAELMRHIPVDAYGSLCRNRQLEHDEGRATRLEVIGRYRFTLAFENSICPDYVTEKFFDPLVAGSVPIYRGAPEVATLAPGEHCFVDASAFRDPAALADHLRQLAADETAYNGLFAWKRAPLARSFLDHAESQRESIWLRLARALHVLQK